MQTDKCKSFTFFHKGQRVSETHYLPSVSQFILGFTYFTGTKAIKVGSQPERGGNKFGDTRQTRLEASVLS